MYFIYSFLRAVRLLAAVSLVPGLWVVVLSEVAALGMVLPGQIHRRSGIL